MHSHNDAREANTKIFIGGVYIRTLVRDYQTWLELETGNLSLYSLYQMRFDLQEGFPMVS